MILCYYSILYTPLLAEKNEIMNSKHLIAIVTNNDDDIYCFRKELIEALIIDGYDILISCPYGEKFELMKDISYIYDNPVIDRRGTSVIKDFGLFIHYKRLFTKYSPSVVLTYTAKPNVFASIAAKQLRIPYINNVTGLGSVINKSVFVKTFIMSLFKYAYRSASCVMFQNEANMKFALEHNMLRGEYKLLPGSGVNTERFPLQPYPEGGDGITGAPVVFNYIGRILRDKGVDDYIEAAKRIKAKFPKTEFNMIGFIEPSENHYEKELKELQDQGIIIYRGSQKDVRPFIARSHAIIHPSRYGEGMSNVLLENASSGRPLITTDNPGCEEIVNDCISGFKYHIGNVSELIQKIETFISDIPNQAREQMGLEGRKKVEQEFSREVVVVAYLEKIGEILCV